MSENKWISIYGNAVSVNENRPESYAKDITLRYTITCPFNGEKLRATFDNFCGKEDIVIKKATALYKGKYYELSFDGNYEAYIKAGMSRVSDEIPVSIKANSLVKISFYLKDYTSLRSAVYVSGPRSKGEYALGDMTNCDVFPIDTSRPTNIVYFLSDVSVYSSDNNKCILCYGDSITAQDWPDYMAEYFCEHDIDNISVIRKATSGSRILREYSCITYESYGLMGKRRFEHEIKSASNVGAVIIQQGINDIIHPVGKEINPFRPISDLPTSSELIEGFKWYIEKCREYGLKVFGGTLLPIKGWRTYADFREVLRNEFNDFIRATDLLDGVIDFDVAVRDKDDISAFYAEYDSGDHLHPSKSGYDKMGQTAFEKMRFLSNGQI